MGGGGGGGGELTRSRSELTGDDFTRIHELGLLNC